MERTSNYMNEEHLIELAQAGDKKALAEIVKKYEQTIYNFAFKICRNKDKAEHTMQETFLSLIKSLNQFGGKSKLSTWLYTVVSNHCLMMARTNKKFINSASFDDDEAMIDESSVADWSVSPSRIIENNELKELLDNAIEELPADYKVVFMLRDVEGLSTEETSEIVNLSIPAVKSRLHRARAFLRNKLNEALKYA